VAVARRVEPQSVESKTTHKIAGRELSVLASLSLDHLKEQITHMSSAQIRAAVRQFEERYPASTSPKPGPHRRGTTPFVPLNRLVPNQAQMSWDHVRDQMLSWVAQVAERREELHGTKPPKKGARHLLAAAEAMKGNVTKDGALVEISDNNHHAAALQALKVVVDRLLAKVPPGQRPKSETRCELDLVRELFGGQGAPLVPVRMVRRKKGYLKTRDGRILKRRPGRYSDCEDNPFRHLASLLGAKVKVKVKDGKVMLRIRGEYGAVWLKVARRAPDFIEFYIAEALEQTFKELGLRYDPRRPPGDRERLAARVALLRIKNDPQHPLYRFISKIPVVAHDRSLSHIKGNLTLEGRRVIVRDTYMKVGDRLDDLSPELEKLAKKPLSLKLKYQPGVVH
jgi:hypothetical protein